MDCVCAAMIGHASSNINKRGKNIWLRAKLTALRRTIRMVCKCHADMCVHTVDQASIYCVTRDVVILIKCTNTRTRAHTHTLTRLDCCRFDAELIFFNRIFFLFNFSASVKHRRSCNRPSSLFGRSAFHHYTKHTVFVIRTRRFGVTAR